MGFHISFPIPTKLMYNQQVNDMQSNECGLADGAARISFSGRSTKLFPKLLICCYKQAGFSLCPGQKQV